MPKIKIIVDENETPEQAEEKLYKAMESHRTGDAHTEKFSDAAMADLVEMLERKHQENYDEMMREIFELLDKEYSNGY